MRNSISGKSPLYDPSGMEQFRSDYDKRPKHRLSQVAITLSGLAVLCGAGLLAVGGWLYGLPLLMVGLVALYLLFLYVLRRWEYF